MARFVFALAACFAALSVVASVQAEDRGGNHKYSLEDVMKKGMKGGLCKKVARGRAKKDEVKTLIAMFAAMAGQKPHKGDAKSWQAKCASLLTAAKQVQAGVAGAGAKLAGAAKCKACHTVHKK
jgi:hypothetical protein